jgi:hypothetical protein
MTLAKFKTRLTEILDEMPQQLMSAAFISFEKRCGAVVKERGEIFDKLIQNKYTLALKIKFC